MLIKQLRLRSLVNSLGRREAINQILKILHEHNGLRQEYLCVEVAKSVGLCFRRRYFVRAINHLLNRKKITINQNSEVFVEQTAEEIIECVHNKYQAKIFCKPIIGSTYCQDIEYIEHVFSNYRFKLSNVKDLTASDLRRKLEHEVQIIENGEFRHKKTSVIFLTRSRAEKLQFAGVIIAMLGFVLALLGYISKDWVKFTSEGL